MPFRFSNAKSESLRRDPKRGVGFEEAQEVFTRPYQTIPRDRMGQGQTGDAVALDAGGTGVI
jgi:uncharacterized DUF497 family protein